MKLKTFFLKLLISFSILGILIYKVGVTNLLNVFIDLNPIYIPLILIIIFTGVIFAAWKLRIFLKQKKIKISFLKIYHLSFLSWSLSLLFPGRVGELLLIYFLKKEKVNLGVGSALVILDKLVGLIATFILALGALFIFFEIVQSLKIIAFFLIFFLIFLYLIFSDFGRGIVKRFILRKWQSKFAGFSKTLFFLLKKHKLGIFYNLILSIIKWCFNALPIYFLFKAFGQDVSILMVIFVASAQTIISTVPISINGLGVKESVGVFLFYKIGVPALISTSVFLLLIVITYFTAVIYIFLFYGKKSINLSFKKDSAHT